MCPRVRHHGKSSNGLLVVCLSILALCIQQTSGEVRIVNDLENPIVHEGEEARFVCVTSDIDKDPRSDPTIVHWKFNDHLLKLDVKVRGDRITSETFQNEHTLIITKTRPDDQGTYTCIVKSGHFQDMGSVRLIVQSVPDPPTHVRLRSCYGNSAEVTWRPSNANGAEVLAYSIQFNISDQPDTWYDYYDDADGKDSQMRVALSPYATYSFRVLARNEVGTSKPSHVAPRTCTTPPDRPDRNPMGVHTKTDKKGYLVIEWKPLRRLSFHGPGFRYIVLWRWKGGLAWNSATVEGSHTNRLEIEVDKVYTLVECQVRAANDVGDAHQPAFVFRGRSFESEPLVTVSGLKLDRSKPVTSSTAHFVWEAVDPKDRAIRGKFKGYKIIYWRWQAGEERDFKVSLLIPGHGVKPGDEIRASLANLPAHSTIGVKVVVVNTHYQGPPSQVLEVYTPEGVPSAVRRLMAKTVTSNSITISWFPPSTPNGILTGYSLGWQEVLGNRLSRIRPISGDDPSQLRARISKLKPMTRYRIHIAAKTKVGPGETSFIDVLTKSTSVHRASTASDQASSLLEVDGKKSDEIEISQSGNNTPQTRLLSQTVTVMLLCLAGHLVSVLIRLTS